VAGEGDDPARRADRLVFEHVQLNGRVAASAAAFANVLTRGPVRPELQQHGMDPVVDVAEKARFRFVGSACFYRQIALTAHYEVTRERTPESSRAARLGRLLEEMIRDCATAVELVEQI
jgi:hypothetical protein